MGEGDGVVFGYFYVVPGGEFVNIGLWESEQRWRRYSLGIDLCLADPQSPDTAVGIVKLVEQRLGIRVEVLVEDDVDARVLGVLGHLDGSAAEDGDLGDVFHLDHGVEHPSAHKACCSCEDEMHCGRSPLVLRVVENVF